MTTRRTNCFYLVLLLGALVTPSRPSWAQDSPTQEVDLLDFHEQDLDDQDLDEQVLDGQESIGQELEKPDLETRDLEAQDRAPQDKPSETPGDSEGEIDDQPADEDSSTTHPCREDYRPDAWLDRMQLQVYEAVCGSAHWFDSFFGASDRFEDRHKPYGRVSANLQYDSIRGLEPKLRMRARITLPHFEDKVQAMVGRGDQDELLRDEATEFRNVTPSLRDTEDEWLLGLGYRPFGGSKQQLDFTGGLNLRIPLDPFVAARYRRHFVPGRSTLVRFRQTLFWRNVKGTGVATRLDVDRAFGENHLARWTSNATYAEETEGVEWRTSLTLYQNLRDGEAVAYQANWVGETEAPVTIEEFGLQAIYRKQVLREWLFLQVTPGVVWRREERTDPRAAVPVIGIGIEMLFGDHRRSRDDD